MKCLSSVILGLLFSLASALADYEGDASDWKGFVRFDFKLGDRQCILVTPKQAAEGRPWIWRARFFGHEPQADIVLLEKGYHVAYCEVGALFGSPQAVAHWDAFYAHVVGKYNLARKVALEGMSRGGLIIYNWAGKNPDKVACIYGDAPVCDIRSWPGGIGTGKGSLTDWQAALTAYRLTEASATDFKGNPIDQLAPLVEAGIPILHVVGEADDVVPVAENSDVIEKRYRELGGSMEVIRKPGIGHHPHALEDPTPIVDFVSEHVSASLLNKPPSANAMVRYGLTRSGISFDQLKKGHVAFIGGSITEMNGYRPMVCDLLKTRFPETNFTFTDAGISSTCSTTGAFRLEDDVLSKGPVDLLFVEFAVNDDQDAVHARRDCMRGLEGIIRRARQYNKSMDMVVTYFVNEPILEALQEGRQPVSIAAHETVTEHYQIPAIHLAREVAERVTAGRLTWKQFGGTHPAPYGNRLCVDLIDQLFTTTWSPEILSKRTVALRPLPKALDQGSYRNGRFLPITTAKLPASGWEVGVPLWKELPGNCRSRFQEVPMLSTTTPGEILTLGFEGVAVGAYVLAGPDAGVAEVSIDGGAWNKVSLYHRFSKGLHYPRTVMFATDLAQGKHTLQLKVSADAEHKGTAMRILQFVAN
ncbi:MAG: pimeloyl-ACP methyl ester carboxylesterase/lysophospholipase L1-like esterase [Verrucomicrobiales bacterium]|jgi:pimeloyl-ACP methyl ester carboxylesterase/lysophospholipase L1-like esterase